MHDQNRTSEQTVHVETIYRKASKRRCDNVLKLVQDGLQGAVYADDTIVTDGSAQKEWVSNVGYVASGRCVITVEQL